MYITFDMICRQWIHTEQSTHLSTIRSSIHVFVHPFIFNIVSRMSLIVEFSEISLRIWFFVLNAALINKNKYVLNVVCLQLTFQLLACPAILEFWEIHQ